MKEELKGQVIRTVKTKAHAIKMAELEKTIGTASARDTASLALFFGPTVEGDLGLIEDIGLDLGRALLGGFELRWSRPFVPDEPVVIETRLADVSTKGNLQFGVVETKISTPDGEEIQLQTTTFIERQGSD